MPRGVQAKGTVRLCSSGYACGDTCISKQKVCLKKLASNRANEMAKRYASAVKSMAKISSDVRQQKSTPDLITDV